MTETKATRDQRQLTQAFRVVFKHRVFTPGVCGLFLKDLRKASKKIRATISKCKSAVRECMSPLKKALTGPKNQNDRKPHV